MQTTADADIEQILESAAVVVRALRRQPVAGTDQAPVAVLAALSMGGARATDIAKALCLDTSTVSRHFDALAARGLVERQPDPADRRARLALVTPAGRELLQQTKAARRKLVADEIATWDPADVATLARLTRRLADGISTTLQEGPRA